MAADRFPMTRAHVSATAGASAGRRLTNLAGRAYPRIRGGRICLRAYRQLIAVQRSLHGPSSARQRRADTPPSLSPASNPDLLSRRCGRSCRRSPLCRTKRLEACNEQVSRMAPGQRHGRRSGRALGFAGAGVPGLRPTDRASLHGLPRAVAGVQRFRPGVSRQRLSAALGEGQSHRESVLLLAGGDPHHAALRIQHGQQSRDRSGQEVDRHRRHRRRRHGPADRRHAQRQRLLPGGADRLRLRRGGEPRVVLVLLHPAVRFGLVQHPGGQARGRSTGVAAPLDQPHQRLPGLRLPSARRQRRRRRLRPRREPARASRSWATTRAR